MSCPEDDRGFKGKDAETAEKSMLAFFDKHLME
jgi:hypothetical protein